MWPYFTRVQSCFLRPNHHPGVILRHGGDIFRHQHWHPTDLCRRTVHGWNQHEFLCSFARGVVLQTLHSRRNRRPNVLQLSDLTGGSRCRLRYSVQLPSSSALLPLRGSSVLRAHTRPNTAANHRLQQVGSRILHRILRTHVQQSVRRMQPEQIRDHRNPRIILQHGGGILSIVLWRRNHQPRHLLQPRNQHVHLRSSSRRVHI
jgi:hypothetical protein